MVVSGDAERFFGRGGRGDAASVCAHLATLRVAIERRLVGVSIPWDRVWAELALRSSDRELTSISAEGAVEVALACACVEQDTRALADFEARYIATIPRALSHMNLGATAVEDVAQTVRTKLLVADSDGEIKLVRYAGGGSLQGLVKVTAIRTAISMLRKNEGVPAPADDLDRLSDQADNPELTFLKAHYRQAFAEAFEHAVAALDKRERNVMRLHLLGGMTLQDVAGVYNVNRSTIVRTLQKARERLLSETRKHLRDQLSVGASELDSVVALIRSRLDVSLGRLLQTLPPEEP